MPSPHISLGSPEFEAAMGDARKIVSGEYVVPSTVRALAGALLSLEEQLETQQEVVRRYVVEISRAPGNRDQAAVDAASEALVALVSNPASQPWKYGDPIKGTMTVSTSPASAPAPAAPSDGTAGAEESSPANSPLEADGGEWPWRCPECGTQHDLGDCHWGDGSPASRQP